MELNHTEFWIQVHDLPPELMSVSMAKQFGDFCGKYIEYDASIPTLGIQHYMRIRICLNVATPLKRKKKVLIGKSMVVYARFKRRNMAVSRWLRAIDGSPYSEENLAGIMYGNARDSGRNLNPNLIHLGPDPIQCGGRIVKKRDGCIDNLTTNGIIQGEMELDLEEENEPLELSEGKKRQRIVERSRVLLDANVGSGSMNVSASSEN
ncbi:hypothetical protein GOBAR_DD05240 [Gossypium barbadense]|nr:hypothetical protein GOBAR_DD05240 [Gossypium barbadense]